MTVEAAIALGALVLVLAVVLAGLGAAVVRLRCVDAAGEAARLAARGDPGAGTTARRLLPEGTEVTVRLEGDDVAVVVSAPPLGAALPGVRVGARARAAREPGVTAPAADAEPPTEDAAAPPVDPATVDPATADPATVGLPSPGPPGAGP